MQELDQFYRVLIESITKQVTQNVLNKIDTRPIVEDEPLTPEEVSEFLKIDKTTVYKMCKEEQIKTIKVGSIHSKKPHLRIRKKDLYEWLNKPKEGV